MTTKYTLTDIAAHDKSTDCWMAIHGKVYDITKFLPEHPGGEEVVLTEAGQDATEAFDDVGHSEEARDMLVPYLIGETDAPPKVSSAAAVASKTAAPSSGSGVTSYLLPVAFLVAFLAYRYYTKTA